MIDPKITVTGGQTDAAAITCTGSTSIKYRKYTAAGTPSWGDWTDYSAAIQVAVNDKIEAYGLHTDGTKTITVSHTVTAAELE